MLDILAFASVAIPLMGYALWIALTF